MFNDQNFCKQIMIIYFINLVYAFFHIFRILFRIFRVKYFKDEMDRFFDKIFAYNPDSNMPAETENYLKKRLYFNILSL